MQGLSPPLLDLNQEDIGAVGDGAAAGLGEGHVGVEDDELTVAADGGVGLGPEALDRSRASLRDAVYILEIVVSVNPDHPRLSIAQALRAMIHATTSEDTVNDIVLTLLRQTQEGV